MNDRVHVPLLLLLFAASCGGGANNIRDAVQSNGSVPVDSIVEAHFSVSNPLKVPIVLEGYALSCVCEDLLFDGKPWSKNEPQAIPVDKSGQLTLVTKARSGPREAVARVRVGVGNPYSFLIKLRYTGEETIVRDPANIILGDVMVNERIPVVFSVKSKKGDLEELPEIVGAGQVTGGFDRISPNEARFNGLLIATAPGVVQEVVGFRVGEWGAFEVGIHGKAIAGTRFLQPVMNFGELVPSQLVNRVAQVISDKGDVRIASAKVELDGVSQDVVSVTASVQADGSISVGMKLNMGAEETTVIEGRLYVSLVGEPKAYSCPLYALLVKTAARRRNTGSVTYPNSRAK